MLVFDPRFVVFYNDFETLEQNPPQNMTDAIKQAQEGENPTAIYQKTSKNAFVNVSQVAALQWLDSLMKDGTWAGREEDEQLPNFITLHLQDSWIMEYLKEQETWLENPA